MKLSPIQRIASFHAEKESICLCGCGLPAGFYKNTDSRTGQTKGFPRKFIRGHHTASKCLEEKAKRTIGVGSVPNTEEGAGICFCGCGGKTKQLTISSSLHGLYRGEWRRYITGHNRRLHVYYVELPGPLATPCWWWQGRLNESGYGTIKRDGKQLHAHRYYYQTAIGPIPQGMELDHLCRNRVCVCPQHLEPVSDAVNVQRGLKAKLSPEQVLEIFAYPHLTAVALAPMFGVSNGTIGNIRRGKSWSNITESLRTGG